MRCSVISCKSDSGKKEDGVSFHCFPADNKMRKKWIAATGRTILPKVPRMCSRHFPPDKLIKKVKHTFVLPNALPNKELLWKVCKEPAKNLQEESLDIDDDKSILKSLLIDFDETVSCASPDEELSETDSAKTISEQQICHISSKPETDKAANKTIRILQKKLQRSLELSAVRLKKLKAVRERCRRLEKKIAELQEPCVCGL